MANHNQVSMVNMIRAVTLSHLRVSAWIDFGPQSAYFGPQSPEFGPQSAYFGPQSVFWTPERASEGVTIEIMQTAKLRFLTPGWCRSSHEGFRSHDGHPVPKKDHFGPPDQKSLFPNSRGAKWDNKKK